MIRHIVHLRFRDGTPDAVRQALHADPAGLARHIGGILDFRDTAVRDAYLADPAHQAIGARIVAATEGGIDGVLVGDLALP
jgi:hypothetical protein